jgi:hypothetical protein
MHHACDDALIAAPVRPAGKKEHYGTWNDGMLPALEVYDPVFAKNFQNATRFLKKEISENIQTITSLDTELIINLPRENRAGKALVSSIRRGREEFLRAIEHMAKSLPRQASPNDIRLILDHTHDHVEGISRRYPSKKCTETVEFIRDSVTTSTLATLADLGPYSEQFRDRVHECAVMSCVTYDQFNYMNQCTKTMMMPIGSRDSRDDRDLFHQMADMMEDRDFSLLKKVKPDMHPIMDACIRRLREASGGPRLTTSHHDHPSTIPSETHGSSHALAQAIVASRAGKKQAHDGACAFPSSYAEVMACVHVIKASGMETDSIQKIMSGMNDRWKIFSKVIPDTIAYVDRMDTSDSLKKGVVNGIVHIINAGVTIL